MFSVQIKLIGGGYNIPDATIWGYEVDIGRDCQSKQSSIERDQKIYKLGPLHQSRNSLAH